MENDQLNWLNKLERHLHNLMDYYKFTFETSFHPMENHKFNPIELELLDLLERNPELSIKDAVAQLCVPNSTITSTVNRLEERGILLRKMHPTDKRTYILELTKSGQGIAQYRNYKKRQFLYSLLLALDSREEQETLVNLFDKISTSLSFDDKSILGRVVMNNLQKEYDAFGPWLTAINEEGDIPHQYVDKQDMILNALYSFKVPVDIERRNAQPGMLLYKDVVSLFDTKVVILSYSESGIEEIEINYEDILYVQNSNDLLSGVLIFASKKAIQTVSYNPVSESVMDKAVQIIRDKSFSPSKKLDMSKITESQSVESQLFRNLLKAVTDEDKDVKVIEYQPFMELKTQTPVARELYSGIDRKPVLQDCMFLTNGKELIVVNRKKEVKGKEDPDYSFRHTYISLDGITDIRFEDAPGLENLQILTISLESVNVEFKVSSEITLENLIPNLLKG